MISYMRTCKDQAFHGDYIQNSPLQLFEPLLKKNEITSRKCYFKYLATVCW